MRWLLAVTFVLFFVAGCQPQELKLETSKTSNLEVSGELTQSDKAEDNRPLFESNAKPRELYIGSDNRNHVTTLLKYCWSKEIEGCLDDLNVDPVKAMASNQVMSIKPSTPLYYSMLASNTFSKLPLPTSIEIFLYEAGEYIPVTIETRENYQLVEEGDFLAPSSQGVYSYVLKTTYTGDVNGISYYGFKIRVSP